MKDDFNFESGKAAGIKPSSEAIKNLREAEQRLDAKIATSGNPKKKKSGGPNPITPEIKAKAIALAESPKGLDIAAFQKKYNIDVMNVDQLLKG